MKRRLVEILALLSLAFVPAIGHALHHRNKVSWQSPVAASDEIDVAAARRLGGNAIWLDARPEDEFAAEHVPGALSLNEEHWNELLPAVLQAWAPDKQLIVYCSSKECGASREVARRLKSNAGLGNVRVLSGGWEAWKNGR